MKKLDIFDPAMCCSTGVCGVEVDPVLAQFAADLKWLSDQGIAVQRHNLGQEPQAFAANPAVLKEMEASMERLPILMVDGQIISTGAYPSRQQLAQKLGVDPASSTTATSPAKTCCAPKSGCC
ncbi:MAG: arsenite efflux transporter metallochaperone ArsD [Dechloromonas sp.]|nr:arsenite efflux transporter metallochaperone ArsD [Dechloromonas sp.]